MTPLELDRRHYPYYERDDYGRCPFCGKSVDCYASNWVPYADCRAHRKCAEPDCQLEDALYNISLYMGRNRAKVEAAARTGEAL
jgi:hypothetical protein